MGFYAVDGFAGQGYMSAGLKLLLEDSFTTLLLHRVEANVQPDNTKSLNLIHTNGFRKAIAKLENHINANTATEVWEAALGT